MSTVQNIWGQDSYLSFGSAVLNGSIEDIEKGLIKDGYTLEIIGKDDTQRMYKGQDNGTEVNLILKQNTDKELSLLSSFALFDEIKPALQYMFSVIENVSNKYDGNIIEEYIYPEESTNFPELTEYTYIIKLNDTCYVATVYVTAYEGKNGPFAVGLKYSKAPDELN